MRYVVTVFWDLIGPQTYKFTDINTAAEGVKIALADESHPYVTITTEA